MTLWSAHGRNAARARGRGVPRAPTTPSCCRTTAGRPRPRAPAPRRRAARRRRARRGAEAVLATLEWEPGDEDVHTLIERRLGEVGRKIHAGRSRNDQVALPSGCTSRTPARRPSPGSGLAATILDRADEEAETPMPGYTHLQRAQPVTVGHHLLAWMEMLERDRTRFEHAPAAAEPSPLGAGALAGSTLGCRRRRADRPQLARRRRRPRLRARLPLRGRGPLHAPLAHRRGARALDDRRVRLRAWPRRPRRGRR